MTKQVNPTPQTNYGFFWSPLQIFLLGTSWAALNWWRMGKRRKAILFLCASIIVQLIYIWAGTNHPYTQENWINNIILFSPLLVLFIYNLTLAFIMFHDIQTFSQSGQQSREVLWVVVIPFLLLTTLISGGISLGIDKIAQPTKYCGVPHLQDFLYDHMLAQRSELQTTLVNHYDFECKIVSWALEHYPSYPPQDYTKKTIDTVSYMLAGRQKSAPDSIVIINHSVFLYQETVSQAMIDSYFSQPDPAINIHLDTHYANYFGYKCHPQIDLISCHLVLGYQHVLSSIHVSVDRISDQELEQLLSVIIDNIDLRTHQYELNH